MSWRSWRFMGVLGTIGLAACVGCVRSRDDEKRRDTLFVGSAVPATTVPAPRIDSGPALTRLDTLALQLDAFVGFTRASSSASSLPELAMVAVDGRRVGFDPATRRTVFELPGAQYESEAAPDDDNASPDTPASVSAEPGIDVRILNVPVKDGDAYTLVVAAQGAGSFALKVSLSGRLGDGSVPLKPQSWEDTNFALRRGEVRRLIVRVGDGTLEVRLDTSAR